MTRDEIRSWVQTVTDPDWLLGREISSQIGARYRVMTLDPDRGVTIERLGDRERRRVPWARWVADWLLGWYRA